MNLITPGVLGGATGVGLGIGASKLYTKATGNTAGVPGSFAHIMTNGKLDKQGKVNVLKEQLIEQGKDTLKLGASAAAVGGTAALAYAKSPRVATALTKAKTKIGEVLSKFSVNGKNLKETIKGTNIFEKISKLPTPAKVAIAVAAGAIALASPIFLLVQSQKAGYIEGKNEVK